MCGSRAARRAQLEQERKVGMAHRQRQAESEMVRRVNLGKKVLRLVDPKELLRMRHERIIEEYGPRNQSGSYGARGYLPGTTAAREWAYADKQYRRLSKSQIALYYDPDEDISSGGSSGGYY